MLNHQIPDSTGQKWASHPARQAAWSLDDIPYDAIESEKVRHDDRLFYLVAAASFVEITSDLYTANLVSYFDGDASLQAWLANQWEKEEIQHGLALKRYVTTVWPEFDWERAYEGFLAEYSLLCNQEHLGPTRSLELVARCVVETGTSTLYTLVQRLSPEPVLSKLAGYIRTDEVRHFKYFYRYFLDYRQKEHPRRLAVLRSLWQRVAEIDDEDSYVAFKHVFRMRYPNRTDLDAEYQRYRDHMRDMARDYYPFDMAVKMFLKPLRLHSRIQRITVPVLSAGTRYFMLR